ncbi:MAG: ComEC/Rec2 family competence protein [Patescibacteria group bacterium]
MGRVFSWSFAMFLLGIGIHSLDPWARAPPVVWILCAAVSATLLSTLRRSGLPFTLVLITTGLLVGLWRFDLVPLSDLHRLRQFHVHTTQDSLRRRLTHRIEQTLPRDEATLLTGIMYGDQMLTIEQRDLMRRSGLLHLVAVSGSNVTIIVTLLLGAILSLGFHRRHAFWIVSVGIFAFIAFVGFSASVVRSGIMGWLVVLARHVGRISAPSRLLLIAASAMTFVTPTVLFFDRGFALSFLATWGLIAWSPIFERWFTILPRRLSIRESAATTCSATLLTAPYLAWAFGRMSLAGLLTNLLALPLVPWIMLCGGFVAAWGDLPGSIMVRLPTLGLLRLLERIAHIADVVPWLDLHVQKLDLASLVVIYLCVWRIWRSCREKIELSTR